MRARSASLCIAVLALVPASVAVARTYPYPKTKSAAEAFVNKAVKDLGDKDARPNARCKRRKSGNWSCRYTDFHGYKCRVRLVPRRQPKYRCERRQADGTLTGWITSGLVPGEMGPRR